VFVTALNVFSWLQVIP